ncbi:MULTISPECIES: DUF4082 domain-containing protein [Flavobacterium]|uniref:DUF4082 domain-containing protein n=1 Tax=Flavobacterium hankyongi TaxID=1176532 RepID=A0ABP8ZQH0_9FLAO|nr:DUF4082 domain-containing protein [Flavobacterium sp. N1846]
MKIIKNLLGISILSVVFFSCSKDDDNSTSAPTIVEQNPLSGYLSTTGFNQKTTNYVNSGDYEFGISFTPQANGKITALIAKIPDVRVGMRVTIWDKATATILRTELVDVTSSGVEITKAITPLEVVKDTEYMITYNSNDWYDHRKNDSSVTTYPVTVGDVKITSYGYKAGTDQAVPNIFPANYYAGDLTFKFVKS